MDDDVCAKADVPISMSVEKWKEGAIKSGPIYFFDRDSNKCGYCKRPTANSHVILAKAMLPYEYDALVDRGFRRCNEIYYKRCKEKVCCALLPIRCDVEKFRPSRYHRSAVRRLMRVLCQDEDVRQQWESIICADGHWHDDDDTVSSMKQSRAYRIGMRVLSADGLDGDESRISAKHKRWLRKMEKLKKAKRLCSEKDVLDQLKQGTNSSKANQAVFKFLQFIELEDCPLKFRTFRVGTPHFGILELLREEYPIFERYQMKAHKESKSKNSFVGYCNFLVSSSLMAGKEEDVSRLELEYGTFHEQYLLYGQLIAVSVFDVLPSGISSVYFFYDPSYSSMSLGTISAIRDIYKVLRLSQFKPGFHFYHLGLFLRTNPKLKYKARFRPCELLCPFCYKWTDYGRCEHLLEQDKYVCLCGSGGEQGNVDNLEELDKARVRESVKVSFFDQCFTLNEMDEKDLYYPKHEEELVYRYTAEVGFELAARLPFIMRYFR